jgi:hypothetical protein
VGNILAGFYMLVGPIVAASVNRLVVELKGQYSSSVALVRRILAGVYMPVGPIAAVSVNRLVVE